MSIDMKAWGDQSYNVTGYITKLLSDVCTLYTRVFHKKRISWKFVLHKVVFGPGANRN